MLPAGLNRFPMGQFNHRATLSLVMPATAGIHVFRWLRKS
jgi:hypothetical protein